MRWFIVFSLLIQLSCNSTSKEQKAGVCLSFDDRSISEWHSCRSLFDKYDARCTFFITQFDQLNTDEIKMLHDLQDDGHEIASHGAQHEIAEFYIKEHGYHKYLNDEVDKSIREMHNSGFNPVSFSYPYGSAFWFTDALLLKRFKRLRKVATLGKDQEIDELDCIYYSFDDARILSSLAIDNNTQITTDQITKALDRVSRKNEIVMFFAHTPTDSVIKGSHMVSKKRLQELLSEAQSKGLVFYTFDSL